MKTFRMRYYYMAPLLVLAMVACAKRDNDFAKKAAAAKAAAQQQKPGAQTSPTPTPTPGRGTTADTAATDKKDSYKGDLSAVRQDSCANPIAMEINTDNDEKELSVDDLITKDKASYVLQSTKLFVETTAKGADKATSQIALEGSLYELPKDFKSQAQATDKAMVTCLTKTLEAATGGLTLPYDISTEDGSIKNLRQDKLELTKTSTALTSTLYAQAQDAKDLKVSPDGVDSYKLLIVGGKDNAEITIKTQTVTKDTSGNTIKKTVMGTYSLKK